ELAAKEFIYEGYKDKDFQENGTSKVITRFNQSLAEANETLRIISASSYLDDPETSHLVVSLFESKAITQGFIEAKDLLKKRGFKDFGLEGSLRAAIHQIENSSLDYDRSTMLTLRRHEKDFFLRKDLKYQKEFNDVITLFSDALRRNGNDELLTLLSNYQNEFNQVVEIEKEIGLHNQDGKKGLLFAELQNVRAAIDTIRVNVHQLTEAQISQSKTLLIVIFSFQLIAAIALAFTYSNVLTSVIKEIRTTMRQLAEGIFPAPLSVRSTEEIGQTKTAINQFLERLKIATTYAEKLGSGELHALYDERYHDDVLAKALVTMQKKLAEAEANQAKTNWHNEGAARFNEILKSEAGNMSALGDSILKVLIEYLQANQGALYVINKEEKCFQRIATYAYGKKKFVDEQIDLESGLTGQCAMEGETIYLKEVPKEYVKITSGLGQATPQSVLIVPLKVREEVNGVIELASLKVFDAHHISFVEKIAENIASILSGHQTALQTKRLLQESQHRAEALAQQEEEMRQNAEELQATQEEMERQRRQMEQEIIALKEKLNPKKSLDFLHCVSDDASMSDCDWKRHQLTIENE
ncbi:MAG: GAF domain-containing protein, partial [Flammeovirgaceae bacterium]|nr:GAF domain-containing protein [Flammeovirgaceae bacterium]